MPAINEELLEERLRELEGARNWPPRVVSRLETLIRSGEDQDLFRINPIKFAGDRNISDVQAVDLLLQATAIGLFRMDWMVLCPLCSSVIESFASLRTVSTDQYHCHFCQNVYEAKLDDYIAVSFTVAPSIRKISFHTPETLQPLEYLEHYAFSGPHLRCDVPPGSSALSRDQIVRDCFRGCAFLSSGEATKFEFVAGQSPIPGESTLQGTEAISGAFCLVSIGGPPTSDPQHLVIEFDNGAWTPAESRLRLGPITLELRNRGTRRIFALAAEFPDASSHCSTPLVFEPYLTAKQLLTTQTFRDLFRAEVIRGTEGIGVRDITLVFTDLKGSTELYERIGDLNALALVQQHFERLQEVTVRHGGVIVKTLGDAVMAAFMTPANAVSGVLAMQAEIALFNETRPERDLLLKIGVHRGAAIAVTLNDRLDYFGQSVNIASRVGALAEGGEICLTREVHDAPEVRGLLKPYSVSVASVQLKGIHDRVPVWRVRGEIPEAGSLLRSRVM
jgi:class 3 adenylate cyclase